MRLPACCPRARTPKNAARDNQDYAERFKQAMTSYSAVQSSLVLHDVPHFSKLFDVHMMCWGTGQERTEPQYVRLLEKAGWKPTSSYYPANRQMGIITGVCA